MKKLKFLLLIFSSTILFYNCDPNNEDLISEPVSDPHSLLSCFEDNVDFPSVIQTDNQFPTPDAEFTINGTDYSISNGYMTSPDDGANGSNYKIILLNGALRFRSYLGFSCCYIRGTNQSVIFNITSTSASELAEGTYPFELTTTDPSLNE